MRAFLPLLVLTLSLPAGASAAPPPGPGRTAASSATPASECDEKTSIVVKLRYPDGQREEYRSEVDTMEMVFDEAGRLAVIHLVLFTGTEKDTHKWIPFQGLSSFSYRFCNVSGKGKIRLSVQQPFYREGAAPAQPQGKGLPAPELPAVTPRDYR